jgi:hypothetical protein
MSERMTCIYLPGHMGAGIAGHGRKTVKEMLAMVRSYARHHKAEAEAVLSASDDDFRVTTYVGVHVQRNEEVIQVGATEATKVGTPAAPLSPAVKSP